VNTVTQDRATHHNSPCRSSSMLREGCHVGIRVKPHNLVSPCALRAQIPTCHHQSTLSSEREGLEDTFEPIPTLGTLISRGGPVQDPFLADAKFWRSPRHEAWWPWTRSPQWWRGGDNRLRATMVARGIALGRGLAWTCATKRAGVAHRPWGEEGGWGLSNLGRERLSNLGRERLSNLGAGVSRS